MNRHGGHALGLSGKDSELIVTEKLHVDDQDIGLVGKVISRPSTVATSSP
jgi:acetylglutamate kinase